MVGWSAGVLQSSGIPAAFPLSEQDDEDLLGPTAPEEDDSSIDDLDSDFYEGRIDDVGRLSVEDYVARQEREDLEAEEAEEEAQSSEVELAAYREAAELRSFEQQMWRLAKDSGETPDESEYDYELFDELDEEPTLSESHPNTSPATATTPPPSSQPTAYWIDAAGYYPYLLFTEQPRSVAKVIHGLRTLGLEPGVAGYSTRPASNGRQYAFYIRLGRLPRSQEDLEATLSKLGAVPQTLGTPQPRTAEAQPCEQLPCEDAPPSEARPTALPAEGHAEDLDPDDGWDVPIPQTGEQAWRTIATKLAGRLQSMIEEGEKRRLALAWHNRERQAAIESLRAARKECADFDALLEQHGNLLDAHDALLQSHENSLAEVGGLTSTIDSARQENQELNRRLEHLQYLLDQSRISRTPAVQAANSESVKVDVRAVIGHLCPNVELLRHSLTTIEQECLEFRDVFKKLYRLQNGEQMKAERVEGAAQWMEVHFSTGRSNDGRAYFSRAGGRIRVLLSLKERQKRDIEWLAKA